MPIYEYRCEKCGRTFEKIQKFSDEPLTVHEDCGGAVERLLSAPAFQFKGSGWYITDYAKSGSSTSTPESKEGSKSESKSESKGDSKSDTKAESSSAKSSESKPAPATKAD